jgi:DNA repair ATPase RecN
MNFIDQMKNDFIPAIERMLEKERMHLVSLLHAKQKFEKRCYPEYVEEIKPMIDNSKQMVVHLEKRLNEYRDYVNNNNMELTKRTEKIKKLKGAFRTFFEGVSDLCPHVYETFIHVSTFEITNLDFAFLLEDETGKKRIEMTVTLGRPGLLIGRMGKTLQALEKYLSDDEYNVKILIKESNLWR